MASVLVIMPLGADEPKASSNLRFCSVRFCAVDEPPRLVGSPMMLISFLSPGENGSKSLVGARTRKSLQSVLTVKVPG
jgi:hypothetical protein